MKRKSVSILFLFLFGCMGGGHIRNITLTPSATIVRVEKYVVLGRSEGQSSTFFLFNLFPVTNPLNIEYAMSQAVQKIPGGQSMVNLNIWHESQYFFPLGRVHVVKVEGDVVSFETPGLGKQPEKEQKKDKQIEGKIKVNKDQPKSNDGGIKVGGDKNPEGGISVGGKR